MIAYEVIRVINSKPLFAADHFQRMLNSLQSVKQNAVLSFKEFVETIKNVIDSRKIINGNVKLEIIIDDNDVISKLLAKQITHHYPTQYDYKNGVSTVTYLHTRENPNSKIWNQSLRERTDEIISLQNVFEVIYVNKANKITEGSRSNIFFVESDKLYSALPQDILHGITRKYIIEIAEKYGMQLVEKDIHLSELETFDAAFISGTSPKILPIRCVNEINFGTNNKYMRLLMTEFDKFIDANINSFSFE
jgi:branched-chain amino acid aminotransferase